MSNNNDRSEPGLWDDAMVISAYSRAQALADGFLIDITDIARQAGFKWPVAITSAAWAELCAWSHGGLQDETGRLWDVVWMAGLAARHNSNRDGDRVTFQVLRIPNTAGARTPKSATVVCHVGPGDHGEPVITMMLPEDD